MNERILTELLESFWKLFMVGVKVTIPLTLATFTTGLLIAFFVALMQIAKVPIMKRLVRVYIWIIRCTPMIVQLFIVYFGHPTIGIKFNSFTSAWIVMSLSIGAYCSETVRAAIESVPIGQLEACYCDGLTFWQAMIHVIVPQALRTAFPPLSNSLIGLVTAHRVEDVRLFLAVSGSRRDLPDLLFRSDRPSAESGNGTGEETIRC